MAVVSLNIAVSRLAVSRLSPRLRVYARLRRSGSSPLGSGCSTTIRGLQLRAILVPVGMAAFLSAALSWYGLVWIPAQQRYLNERNIRLLRTVASQIRSKVNAFDQAIDHAVESFAFDVDDAKSVERLGEYVKLFAPVLEILDKKDAPVVLDKAGKPVDLFSDPPRVTIRLDEGKHYVHLFYKHPVHRAGKTVNVSVVAKTDIERVVADYLSSRTEFDVLALVDHEGRVIAHYSSSGVEIGRVDRVTGAAPATRTGAASSTSPAAQEAPAAGLETLRATGNIADVTIGGAGYKFYVQPVLLSLLSADGTEAEEWGLCGLVRVDHFRAASSAISSTYWLLLIAALAVLGVTIPLLKLHVLSAHERFKGSDGVLVAGTTFLVAGLLTFVLLDVYYFGFALMSTTDRQLRALASDMQKSLTSEAQAALAELDARVAALDAELKARSDTPQATGTEITIEDDVRSDRNDSPKRRLVCKPQWACGQQLLAQRNAPQLYPYFNLIVWSDAAGEQHVKRTTGAGITPFINVREAKLAYYEDVERARRFARQPQRGVSVIRSPNTGDALTVFWTALPGGGSPDLSAASLATTPLSVVLPVLPKDMQFAVLDTSGRVMFHTDQTRNLNENFFQECEGDPKLKAMVLGRTSGTITTQYLGQRHRLHATPIEMASAIDSFRDPLWSLVVFQPTLVPETVNLETLTLAVAMFATFGLVLAAAWALFSRFRPQDRKWFWPDDHKADRYRRATLVNAGLSVLFLTLLARADLMWLLLGTMLLAIGDLYEEQIAKDRADDSAYR